MPSFFYNPPYPILAAGTEKSIDVGGFKGIVSIDAEKNLFIETTMYHELGIGIPDEDVPDQIADFKMGAISEFLEQDFEKSARALGNGFRSMVEHGRLFFGVLTIEVNGFIEPKIFDVNYEILESLQKIHHQYRVEGLFPDLHIKEGDKIPFEFQGKDNRLVFPSGRKLSEILFNLSASSGFAHGFLCNSGGAANFYIAESTLSDGPDRPLSVDAENVEFMRYAIERGLVAPIGFFRFVFRDFTDILDWESITKHPFVHSMQVKYNEYEDKLSADKVQQFVEADQIDDSGALSDDEKDVLKGFLDEFKDV